MIDRDDWCLWCGASLPEERQWNRIYCGRACQVKAAARARTERRQAENLTPRPCAWCRKKFRPKQRSNARCCSQRCQTHWWRARRDPAEKRAYDRQRLAKVKAAQPLKPCAWCGTMFQPSGRPGRAHRFCSQSCVSNNRWARDKVPVEPRNCAQCGKEFLPPKPSSRIRHCSRRCGSRAIAKPLPVITCEGCHRTFTPKRRRSDRVIRFCSRECWYEKAAQAGSVFIGCGASYLHVMHLA